MRVPLGLNLMVLVELYLHHSEIEILKMSGMAVPKDSKIVMFRKNISYDCDMRA